MLQRSIDCDAFKFKFLVLSRATAFLKCNSSLNEGHKTVIRNIYCAIDTVAQTRRTRTDTTRAERSEAELYSSQSINGTRYVLSQIII